MLSNDAPDGSITNWIWMNSNAVVGLRNIWPVNWLLSKSSGLLFNTTLKSERPLSLLMLSNIGLTSDKNWFLTTASFCSNNNLIETAEISFLACNKSLLMLILLR